MILCLDVGNTHIFAGVFHGEKVRFKCRYDTVQTNTSDQMGLFFLQALREAGIALTDITAIMVSSVVPNIDYSLRSACIKYLKQTPLFLQAGVKTGIKVKVPNPKEVGADIIASCMASAKHYPKQNVIIIDCGTATTISALNKEGAYIGSAILPGFRTAMQALTRNAALLSGAEILKPDGFLGNTTAKCIQVGLYYSQLGSLELITKGVSRTYFAGEKVVVIATGGFSTLLQGEPVLDAIYPDLVLEGLRLIVGQCPQGV